MTFKMEAKMRITKIECIPVTLKLKKPILMSGGALTGSICVLVKIHTDEGITGIADSGGTSEWYSGETQESIMALINNYYGPKALLGEDPFNLEKIMAKLEKIAKNNNQSKAVIDYALHDIMGKKLGVPVYKLLGGKTLEKIPLGFVMSTGKPEETSAEAKKLVKAGYGVVKIKVGYYSDEQDIENVRLIRQAVGNKAKVMIDANGGWNYYQALNVLKQLEKYDVALCEQPTPWWDIEGMARLRRKVNIPIFADESATELKQLIEIGQKDAADGLFIKVAKAGGLLRAKKWSAIAKGLGLSVMCGCMAGSGLEAAAQAHFLAADEWMSKLEQENIGPLHLHDLTDTVSVDIKDDLAKKLPRYEKGFLYPPEGPGLGVELNEEIVSSLISPGLKPTSIGK
jgi:L-alanine-DL-glutamate epimerase-like enolase superfamily enzyme